MRFVLYLACMTMLLAGLSSCNSIQSIFDKSETVLPPSDVVALPLELISLPPGAQAQLADGFVYTKLNDSTATRQKAAPVLVIRKCKNCFNDNSEDNSKTKDKSVEKDKSKEKPEINVGSHNKDNSDHTTKIKPNTDINTGSGGYSLGQTLKNILIWVAIVLFMVGIVFLVIRRFR